MWLPTLSPFSLFYALCFVQRTIEFTLTSNFFCYQLLMQLIDTMILASNLLFQLVNRYIFIHNKFHYASILSLSGPWLDDIFHFRYRHLGQFAPLGGDQAAAELPGDWVSMGHSTQWLWYSVYARQTAALHFTLCVLLAVFSLFEEIVLSVFSMLCLHLQWKYLYKFETEDTISPTIDASIPTTFEFLISIFAFLE